MMTHHDQVTAFDEIMELLAEHGFDGMAQAVGVPLNEVMKPERTHALEAAPTSDPRPARATPTASSPRRCIPGWGHRRAGAPDPERRVRSLGPEEGVRSERALKLAVAEMYVQGVSTRKVAAITEKLYGLEDTIGQVIRAAEALDEELEKWRSRPLGETSYLILDALYEKVRLGGSIVSCAVLPAIGIDPQGRRSILGVSVSMSEVEVHWREFLASLQARGLHGVKVVTSDAHAGLKQALAARLTGVSW